MLVAMEVNFSRRFLAIALSVLANCKQEYLGNMLQITYGNLTNFEKVS